MWWESGWNRTIEDSSEILSKAIKIYEWQNRFLKAEQNSTEENLRINVISSKKIFFITILPINVR